MKSSVTSSPSLVIHGGGMNRDELATVSSATLS